MKTTRPIYTMRMARHLIDIGFEPVAMLPNPKDLHKDVWIFNKTPELEAACAEYIKAKESDKKNHTPKISNRLLFEMRYFKGLSLESIAQIANRPVAQIEQAIKSEADLYRAFGIAAMSDAELKEYANATTKDERDKLITDQLKRGGFNVYSGGQCKYSFPVADSTVEGGEE